MFRIRIRSEPSKDAERWIKEFRRHVNVRSSASEKKDVSDDVDFRIVAERKRFEQETRLRMYRSDRLHEYFCRAQKSIREASTRLDDDSGTKEATRASFFILATVSRRDLSIQSQPDKPSTFRKTITGDAHIDGRLSLLRYARSEDASAAYVAVAIRTLRELGIAFPLSGLPNAPPPIVPEPVPPSEIDERCVRPKEVPHAVLAPVLPLYGHGITYGEITLCVQAATLDPRLEWTCYMCVDVPMSSTLLLSPRRSGRERAARTWRTCEWGLPVRLALTAPRELSTVVIALEADIPGKAKKKRKGKKIRNNAMRFVVYEEIGVDELLRMPTSESATTRRRGESKRRTTRCRSRVWGGRGVPGCQWSTTEIERTFSEMKRAEEWHDGEGSYERDLFDFSNLYAAKKKKKGFKAVLGGIGKGVGVVGQGLNVGVGVVGSGVNLVGHGLGATVGVIGKGFGVVGQLGENVPLVGKGIGVVGRGIDQGIGVVGRGIDQGIGTIGSGITSAPNAVTSGITTGLSTVGKTVTSPFSGFFQLDDASTRIETKLRVSVFLTTHPVFERLCHFAYPSRSWTTARDRAEKSESEELIEAIAKVEHALGVLGTIVRWTPVGVVSILVTAATRVKWLSMAASVAFVGICVATYPYMGKTLLLVSLGSATGVLFLVTMVLYGANRLFSRERRKSIVSDRAAASPRSDASRRIGATLLKRIRRHGDESAEAVRFAAFLFLPILRLRLRELAAWCAFLSASFLSAGYAMSYGAADSHLAYLADRLVLIVGFGFIFKGIPPVEATIEFFKRGRTAVSV